MSDDLKKLSARKLADEFGRVHKQAKAEAERLASLKAELEARGKLAYVGEFYDVTKGSGGRSIIDTKKLVAEMGDAWVKARKKWSSWVEWNVTAKPVDDLPAAEPLPGPSPKTPAAAAKVLEAV